MLISSSYLPTSVVRKLKYETHFNFISSNSIDLSCFKYMVLIQSRSLLI